MSDILNLINDAIFVSLVNTTLQITLLIPLIALIIWMFRVRSAATRYSLWLFVIFAIIVLPLITPFIPQMGFARSHGQRTVGDRPDHLMQKGMGGTDEGDLSKDSDLAPSMGAAEAAVSEEANISLINPVSIAYFIWCAGALFVLCITLGAYRKLKKLKVSSPDVEDPVALEMLSRLRQKIGIGKSVTLKTSPEIYTPVNLGIFSPTIMLPDGVVDGGSTGELEMILTHELAHIKRCDCLINLLQNMLRAIFFFHPLFHLMNRNLTKEREHICDDWVIDVTEQRNGYAECIISLLEKALHKPVNVPVTLAMAERKRDIPGRIDMIVDKKRRTTTKTSRRAFVALLLIGCLSIPVIGGIELVRIAGARPASDDGTIVFARGSGFNFEIYTMNPDGSNVRKITDNPATDWFPSISPDGRKIAFSRQPTEGTQEREVWVMDANGKNEKKLADWGWCTSWSPDGKRIVFGRDVWEKKDGKWESIEADICVMNADGSNLETLLEGSVYTPAWSPDGTEIAFARDWPGREDEIWVMDADGQNEKMLTNQGNFPCWSPDGRKIVFNSYRDGWDAWQSADIYVMDADGGNVKRLTKPGPAHDCFPAWSPDGKKIAFCSYEGDNPSEMYVMNADGSNMKEVTDTPEVWEWSLCWTPHSLSYAVEPAGKLKSTWGKIKALMP